MHWETNTHNVTRFTAVVRSCICDVSKVCLYRITYFRKLKIHQLLTTPLFCVLLRKSTKTTKFNFKMPNCKMHSSFREVKMCILGLPWWRSGWESACQWGGHGFKPWSGKIPHAAEQLGPWATTTEPARLEPVLCNKRGRDSERPAHRDEEWSPLAATRESPRTETKTQHSQK